MKLYVIFNDNLKTSIRVAEVVGEANEKHVATP